MLFFINKDLFGTGCNINEFEKKGKTTICFMVCDEIAAMRVCSLKKLQSDSKLTLILSEAQKELVDSIPLMKLIIDCGLFI
jgi:hypothetical protein